MNRQELELSLEDYPNKKKCILCGKDLKSHSLADLNKCFDKAIEAEQEAEMYGECGP